MNLAGESVLTGITGPEPSSPPNDSSSPGTLPIAGMTLTAVVLVFIIPIAASSAIIAEMTSAGVSPGIYHVKTDRADGGHGFQFFDL